MAVDEFSSTVVCKLTGEGGDESAKHTLRVIYKKAVVEQKHQESIVREMDLLKSLSKHSQFSNCPCLPSLISTYSDPQNLYALFQDSLCCSVSCVSEELGGVWDDSKAKHVAMCALLGLEAVHAHGVVYRGLNSEVSVSELQGTSPLIILHGDKTYLFPPRCSLLLRRFQRNQLRSSQSLLLAKDGNIVLTNFQYARQNPEGNVTICGPPEYLAPEVVQQQGHGPVSDLWQVRRSESLRDATMGNAGTTSWKCSKAVNIASHGTLYARHSSASPSLSSFKAAPPSMPPMSSTCMQRSAGTGSGRSGPRLRTGRI